jgi:hypothetical protein
VKTVETVLRYEATGITGLKGGVNWNAKGRRSGFPDSKSLGSTLACVIWWL